MTILNESILCVTPAGGGDVTPAPAASSTLLATSLSGEGAGVVEPPKPESLLAKARSDEIGIEEIFDIDLSSMPDDDSDEAAYMRSTRLICSASTDGQVTIHRFGSAGLVMTADEVRKVYEFLGDSARIWGAAL